MAPLPFYNHLHQHMYAKLYVFENACPGNSCLMKTFGNSPKLVMQ